MLAYLQKFLTVTCIVLFSVDFSPVTAETAPTAIISKTDLLLDKLYAVHATRRLPGAEALQAGWTLQQFNPLEKALLPKIRKTVHFALGELVRPVEGFMSWEDCPYAVVTSLRNLQAQLLNVNCYDTFIFGDLKLTPDIYVVLPIEIAKKIKIKTRATLVTYDSNLKTLRQAVDELIHQKGGWHIEMNSDDIEDELHPAHLNGHNINTLEFFEPLKREQPCLAVGLRFDPLEGEHYRLSQIEQHLMRFAMQLISRDSQKITGFTTLSNTQLEQTLVQVDKHFKKWSRSLKKFKWNAESRQAYKQLAHEIKRWKSLINEELQLRTTYGKTLVSAPESFLLDCAKLLDQPEPLHTFITNQREQLLPYNP